jgi:hypothetical protein
MAGTWGKRGDQPTILPGALYPARHDPSRMLTQLRRPTLATGVRSGDCLEKSALFCGRLQRPKYPGRRYSLDPANRILIAPASSFAAALGRASVRHNLGQWHDELTGAWPTENSGSIPGTRGEVWENVNQALRVGDRGLLGGDTLARLLARRLDIRNPANIPRLTVRRILAWADEHHDRTGQWPRRLSGAIDGAPGESWLAIDDALRQGHRGLKGGSSLARLLARRRGVRNIGDLPRLSIRQILRWADAPRRRTGKWPHGESGFIPHSGGETWKGVEMALFQGLRGLTGGLTLARLRRRSDRSLSGH